MYISKSKVQTYEVQAGSLTNNATFSAIAVRDETVFSSSYSGNINYYQKEASKVKVGDTLVEFDMDAIKKEGYELVTPVIITNTMDYLEIVPKEIKSVNAGEDIITIL